MTATLDAPAVLYGSTTPRLWTRPVVPGPAGPCGCGCPLTPATSHGFQAVTFAEAVLGRQLFPWQRWWLIHVLELRADGRYRFRKVITLIGRQNGKTEIVKALALYFLFMGRAHTVLGCAQSLDIAMEAWAGAVDLAEAVADLAAEIDTVRYTNGQNCLTLTNGARYRIAAASRKAGRGLSIGLLVLDELREHRDWLAWAALSKTTTATHGLIVGISNAGDDESVVLNSLRESALAHADPALGLFEWSAEDGCDLDDPDGWAAANPSLGYIPSMVESLESGAATDPPAVFRTESLCQRVDALDAAVDLAAWKSSADPDGSLSRARARVAACVDVAPDGEHVTLSGAAVLEDGRVRVETLAAWPSTADARRELAPLLDRIKPAVVGWFPSGPSAALGADLRVLDAQALQGADVAEACQEFADLVRAGRIVHPDDPLLNAHIAGTSKLRSGDGWRFARKGAGHVDAAYAAAGAVRLARTLPPPAQRHRARVF
jgi:hypothetical protein